MAGPFELQIREFAAKAKGNADLVVQKVVTDVFGELVLRSPVDTGRFRANWLYGADTPRSGTVLTSGTSESPTPAPDAPAVEAQAMGRVHYVTNNLPYAWPLERGHSVQAPQGLVGLTVIRFNDFIRDAVAELNT